MRALVVWGCLPGTDSIDTAKGDLSAMPKYPNVQGALADKQFNFYLVAS